MLHGVISTTINTQIIYDTPAVRNVLTMGYTLTGIHKLCVVVALRISTTCTIPGILHVMYALIPVYAL